MSLRGRVKRNIDDKMKDVFGSCFGSAPRSMEEVYTKHLHETDDLILETTPRLLCLMADFVNLHRKKQVLKETLEDLWYEEREYDND